MTPYECNDAECRRDVRLLSEDVEALAGAVAALGRHMESSQRQLLELAKLVSRLEGRISAPGTPSETCDE